MTQLELYLVALAPLVFFFIGFWLINRRTNKRLDNILERKHLTIEEIVMTERMNEQEYGSWLTHAHLLAAAKEFSEMDEQWMDLETLLVARELIDAAIARKQRRVA